MKNLQTDKAFDAKIISNPKYISVLFDHNNNVWDSIFQAFDWANCNKVPVHATFGNIKMTIEPMWSTNPKSSWTLNGYKGFRSLGYEGQAYFIGKVNEYAEQYVALRKCK